MNGVRIDTISNENRENEDIHLACIKAEVWNGANRLSHAASSDLHPGFVDNLEVGSDPGRPTSMAVGSVRV